MNKAKGLGSRVPKGPKKAMGPGSQKAQKALGPGSQKAQKALGPGPKGPVEKSRNE